ncbi:MAG: hypothetical protein ACRC5M_03490 [Anaeroplasmataceae bacterium]
MAYVLIKETKRFDSNEEIRSSNSRVEGIGTKKELLEILSLTVKELVEQEEKHRIKLDCSKITVRTKYQNYVKVATYTIRDKNNENLKITLQDLKTVSEYIGI